MKLTLATINNGLESSMGALYINDEFECFTLEDQAQPDDKVQHETRIPAGEYDITLRRGSPMAKRYDDAHRCIDHDGMLWIRGVPGFEWVYFHTGNTDDDTSGCILVGTGLIDTHRGGRITRSRLAYRDLYPRVYEALASGLRVTLEVIR
jgi:hypothetical protein